MYPALSSLQCRQINNRFFGGVEGEWCTSQEALLLLLLSHFSRVRLCVTPWMAAHQAPLSLRFSRQEHWSWLPLPSPQLMFIDPQMPDPRS